ncbi:hypothetical protein DFH27DRAFT_22312 [Peziza echinospora]|nr:hypothetical protein DFH27DRAFT_22312 [Peziza echinospora]
MATTFQDMKEPDEQLATLFSYCSFKEIYNYARSHLWVGEKGFTDINMEDPRFATIELRRAFLKQGGWKYNILSTIEKKATAEYIDKLEESWPSAVEMRQWLGSLLSGNKTTTNSLSKFFDLFMEYILWDLLQNGPRYSRYERPYEAADDQIHTIRHQLAKEHVRQILSHCKLEKDGANFEKSELVVRMRNCTTITALFLEEARYEKEEEKKRRGRRSADLQNIVIDTLKGTGMLDLQGKWREAVQQDEGRTVKDWSSAIRNLVFKQEPSVEHGMTPNPRVEGGGCTTGA